MLKDLTRSKYVGVEAFVKSFSKNLNYVDKCYQEIMEVNINKTGPRRMIGTPTLWFTKILKSNNFDPFFTGPSDDTDVCYKIYKKRYFLEVAKVSVIIFTDQAGNNILKNIFGMEKEMHYL